MSKTLYIVVPCYNEQEVLPETAKRLLEKLQSLVLKNKIADNSRIMFVRWFERSDMEYDKGIM